jgi:kynureninase
MFINDRDFALKMDVTDGLSKFRNRFFMPKINGKEAAYFCGNSLGLQPKTVKENIDIELNDWATHAVEGHFTATNPWYYYHHFTQDALAKIVGANKNEVVAMNALTVNLHLLLISFYTPTKQRYKIIMEAKPFPSDVYALQSQIKLHGFDIKEALIELQPRCGEYTLRDEDILATIDKHKNELALVLIGGVNYYTGQLFNMEAIAAKAHAAGAYCGFDLAHAIGNVPLQLNKWQVDFAAWCSYKYLNSGPGGVAGIFVHEKHHANATIHKLNGWWGYNEEKRFKMNPEFDSMQTAEAWQISNAPVFPMAIHKAALTIFDETDMETLRTKSKLLTYF